MQRLTRRVCAVAVLAALLSVSQSACANEAADKAAVEAAAQSWIKAFNAHDVNALMALATPDVALMDASGSAPVSGSEEVRRALANRAQSKTESTSETKEISIVGDVAWRTGTLIHTTNSGTIVAAPSLEIWRRVKGEWKLHRQMSSGLLVPPRLFTRPDPKSPILDTPQ